MDQLIRVGDHKILEGTTSTLIGCILVVVILAIIVMISSENPDTWNRNESYESTAKHKPRKEAGILPNKYGKFTIGKLKSSRLSRACYLRFCFLYVIWYKAVCFSFRSVGHGFDSYLT